jgi:hypothetical protein
MEFEIAEALKYSPLAANRLPPSQDTGTLLYNLSTPTSISLPLCFLTEV